MPRLIFTPWKELSELLSVREHFYPPPSYDGPDMRAQACALVSKLLVVTFLSFPFLHCARFTLFMSWN